MPIGTLNANRWGIPASEVPNVVASLKQSVVRLCSEPDHACDLIESRKHEIGAVIDAWSDGTNIYAKTRINSDKAKARVREGLLKAWSVYGQGDQHADGFVHNYINKSLTLVADPAWSNAQFKTIAAAKRFMLTNSFKDDIMAPDNEEEKFLAGIKKAVDTSQETLKKEFSDLVASKDKQISDLSALVKQQNDAIAALQVDFKASLEKKIDKPEEKKDETPVFASIADLEALKTGIKTDKDIDVLVAARLQEAAESSRKANAVEDYKTFAAAKNLKIEDAIFTNKTSDMIMQELALLKTVSAASHVPEPVYQSLPPEFAGDASHLTVGIPDASGQWKV